MDETHLNALQRAALDGLARQFYQVGARLRHWSTRPLPLRGQYGTWSTSNNYGVQTTGLKFRDPTLGIFHLTTRRGSLYNWSWYAGTPEAWARMGGSGRELEQCPPGPIPPELFERLWAALHTGCRLYIRHFKLQPEGYARALFPSQPGRLRSTR
jgi:hypothetical protein